MNRQEKSKEERILKLNQVSNLIKMAFAQKKKVEKKKLISYAMFEWGLSYRTTCEYVEMAVIKAGASISKGVILPYEDQLRQANI